MSAARDELAEVLRANGLSDRPADYDSDIHSWRCSYPDRYGPCSCFAELVDDLTRLLDAARGDALRAAAKEAEERGDIGKEGGCEAWTWLRIRAEQVGGAE